MERKEKWKEVKYQLVAINFDLILCLCGLSSWHFLYA